MGLSEQQNFLAKLYTDNKFREKFIAEPFKFGKVNNLSDLEIAELKEILPDEIIAFADSLFYKRLREVEKLLPLTREVFGKKFESLFRAFIQDFNPQGIKKHLEDAIEFAKFLRTKELKFVWAKDIAKLEQSKLEFSRLNKKLIISKFDFDVRGLHQRDVEMLRELEKRKTIAIWFRIGKFHKHFIY